MALYKWAASDRPALGAMASTALLGDVGADDATTGEEARHEYSFGEGCTNHAYQAYLTAVVDLGSVVALTTWRWTASPDVVPGDGFQCGTPFSELSIIGYAAYGDLEISDDGVAWTAVSIGSNQLPEGTRSGAFAGGTTGRYVRVVLSLGFELYDENDTAAAVLTLTDFRVNGEGYTGSCDPPGTPNLGGLALLIANAPANRLTLS